MHTWASQVVLVVKNLTANAGDVRHAGLIPGGGHGNPLQYSFLDNFMDKRVVQGTIYRVTKSQTRLSDFTLILRCVVI